MQIEPYYMRQATLLPTTAHKPVTIIGAGGVGSMTSLVLAKMGSVNQTIYDHDTVEAHNLPSQLFRMGQEGMPKVAALKENVELLTIEPNITAKQMQWDGRSSPVVVCAVDSMATRKAIYEQLKTAYSVELYIEARMSAEMVRLYALRPCDPDVQNKYEATLYSDDEADPAPCTSRAVAYNTAVIAGLIGSLVKKHLMGEPVPFELILDLANYGIVKTV
mgnify:FL=1